MYNVYVPTYCKAATFGSQLVNMRINQPWLNKRPYQCQVKKIPRSILKTGPQITRESTHSEATDYNGRREFTLLIFFSLFLPARAMGR